MLKFVIPNLCLEAT